ncbi:MAG: hypothetical protein IKO20_08755 [Bacteroidaceae bacterium]|nr:hypothetical protein [Bacteroidaceae bacterium]
MNSFDLKKVHDLIMFRDVCATDNAYMTEASSLPRIELETEALYVLTPKTSVLFTPKLRYYRLVIENEINRHINAATNLLEADGTEELTKFVLKKTREAVATLTNEAKRLTILNIGDKNWENIISEKPSIPRHLKAATELAVYSHYVIAELARCWLELQDRYAYVIGEAGCYDVSLFYTSIVGRNPDKEFELKRTEKYEEEAKGFRKVRMDCCFLYDNEEYFPIAIQEFTNKLHAYHLIPDDLDLKQMESLFRGHSCRTKYKWLGPNNVLTHIIKGLTEDDNPVITAWPEGTSKWKVVSCRFVDKDNNPIPNIRQESARKGSETVVKEVVETLAGYLR